MMKWIFCTMFLFASVALLGQGVDVFVQSGKASFYADNFEGRATASGEKYKASKLTAAHLTLPFGTMVKVTNLKNQKEVVVRINDRGPFVEGRIIDVSKAAAEKLDFVLDGLTDVKIEVVKYADPRENPSGYVPGNPVSTPPLDILQKAFYTFEADATQPDGFGVQIGSYQELANLMEVSEQMKNKYKSKTIVQVVKINQVTVYKIIVGNYSDRSKAEKLQDKLQRDYPGCFVFSFSN